MENSIQKHQGEVLEETQDDWYITYQGPKFTPPGTRKYKCNQLVCSVKDFLTLLRTQNTEPYTENVSVIHATTIHKTNCIMKDLPRHSEIVMYVGYVDFDAFAPVGTTPFDFKESLYDSFASGLTFDQVCAKHPDIVKCMLAAALLCKRLHEMGHSPTCWWTGRKGFRVVWTDLSGCFLRCLSGERRVAINVVQIFFKEYLGRELHEAIEKLTFFDFLVYNQHNMQSTGIKPDLGAHYSTGLFPFFMDMRDLLGMADGEKVTHTDSLSSDFPYKRLAMKDIPKDEKLCTFILGFWTDILTNIPAPGHANVLSFTPKPPKEKDTRPAHYEHKPPWERRTYQCIPPSD